ncbi:MAG: anti-anti-sigma factor [Pirellulaceae bacterium]|nr:MAG: anti-anti-sigma factor [Pirellulaceae bacterium]
MRLLPRTSRQRSRWEGPAGPAPVNHQWDGQQESESIMAFLELRDEDDVLVITLTKSKIVDEPVFEQIGKELNDAIAQAVSKKIVLDFQRVEFMSSGMIGRLVAFNNNCKQAGVKLKLCNVSDNLMEVFRITKLNKLLDIQKNLEKALASFEKRGWFG